MTKQKQQQTMLSVLQYIEQHLDEKLDVAFLASLAHYSEFHFHRLFSAFVGEGVYAFKKRLLLERAVKQLLFSEKSLVDIAGSCGYENQASFNKAFKQQFSLVPSQFRQQGGRQKQPRQQQPETGKSGYLSYVERSQKMKKVTPTEITQLDAIQIIAARGTGSYATAAAQAWEQVMKFGYSQRLMGPEVRSFGLSHDDPSITAPENIRYDAGLSIDASIEDFPELRKLTIAGGRYAKFLHEGAYEGFPDTYSAIFHKWLPVSGEQLRDEPCFEIYLNRDPRRTKPENLRTEIYIPLV